MTRRELPCAAACAREHASARALSIESMEACILKTNLSFATPGRPKPARAAAARTPICDHARNAAGSVLHLTRF